VKIRRTRDGHSIPAFFLPIEISSSLSAKFRGGKVGFTRLRCVATHTINDIGKSHYSTKNQINMAVV
jgi:hypothetical protein